MSAGVEEFYENILRDYLSTIRARPADVSVTDYLEEVSNSDNEIQTGIDEEVDIDEEFDLRIFFRCFPENDQDIMLSPINPGMSNEPGDWRAGGKYDRFQRAIGDPISNWDDSPPNSFVEGVPSSIAKVEANHLQQYLTDNENQFRLIIATLQKELPSLPETEFQEYIQADRAAAFRENPENHVGADPSVGFFNDFFYSNACKVATPGPNDIPNRVKNLVKERFVEEIELIDPNLLIVAGALPWYAIWDSLDNPKRNIEEVSGAKIKRGYARRHHSKHPGAAGGLYRIEPMDLWVLTIFHPRWFSKGEQKDYGHLVRNVEKIREMKILD